MFGWLERFEEWRLRRTIARAERVLDDFGESLLTENPPLTPAHERVAQRLVELGTTTDNTAELRRLGNRLYGDGGVEVMYLVLNRALTLSVTQDPRAAPKYAVYSNVSKAWRGIGG